MRPRPLDAALRRRALPRAARAWALALAALSAGAAAAARTPASPRCHRALERLEAHEAALAKSRAADAAADTPRRPDAQALELRRTAARACLGQRDETPLPPPARRVPIEVPSVAAAPRDDARPPVPPRRAAPAVLPPPAPALSLVSCDAGGCWASDGSRLTRAGSQLLGPRGFCSAQGALLQCP